MSALDRYDWEHIAAELASEGYAVLPALGDAHDAWQAALLARLLPIADAWQAALGLPPCAAVAATRTERVLHAGQAQALQKDAPGAFPLQLLMLQSAPDVDVLGGACVLVEQRPRMQSRAVVLPLGKGDAAIVSASARPVRGARGLYQVSMRQAISLVHGGTHVSALLRWQ